MPKRPLRKYFADSGFTDVVKPGGRSYTLRYGKVMVEAIVAKIQPLEVRCKVKTKTSLNHVTDALSNIVDRQLQNQAVIMSNDASRRQAATRRDARSMASAGTKLQGNAADEYDTSQSAKTAEVKADRNRRYDNSVSLVATKVTRNGTAPKGSKARRRKAFMVSATARPSSRSSNNPQTVTLSMPREKTPTQPLRLPPLHWR